MDVVGLYSRRVVMVSVLVSQVLAVSLYGRHLVMVGVYVGVSLFNSQAVVGLYSSQVSGDKSVWHPDSRDRSVWQPDGTGESLWHPDYVCLYGSQGVAMAVMAART